MMLKRTFTREYKLEVIKLARTSGKSNAQLERELGLTSGLIGNWEKALEQHREQALMESCFSTLKSECADGVFDSRSEARRHIFECIEVWYNRQRRHSALGYTRPDAYEQAHQANIRLFSDSTKTG